jgi:hypothetical protein
MGLNREHQVLFSTRVGRCNYIIKDPSILKIMGRSAPVYEIKTGKLCIFGALIKVVNTM